MRLFREALGPQLETSEHRPGCHFMFVPIFLTFVLEGVLALESTVLPAVHFPASLEGSPLLVPGFL